MSANPKLAADTAEWLSYALKDFNAAQADLGSDFALHEDIMFHAQQAAEKSMKAWLLWNNVVFRKTHDMKELSAQCWTVTPALTEVVRDVANLTVFAALNRYPHETEVDPPTREDAQDALRRARAVYDAVCALLPPEARPIEAPPSV